MNYKKIYRAAFLEDSKRCEQKQQKTKRMVVESPLNCSRDEAFRMEKGREVQVRGPATEKARSPARSARDDQIGPEQRPCRLGLVEVENIRNVRWKLVAHGFVHVENCCTVYLF